MSDVCGVLVKKYGMSEAKPCLRQKHICSNHSPDLTGVRIHGFLVYSVYKRGLSIRPYFYIVLLSCAPVLWNILVSLRIGT